MKLPKIPYLPVLIGPYVAFATGFLMNAIVMGVNHATMPVLTPAGAGADFFDPEDLVHGAMTSATHLKFLCDWIVIRGLGIASPGDFGIWACENTWLPAIAVWIALIIKDYNAKQGL